MAGYRRVWTEMGGLGFGLLVTLDFSRLCFQLRPLVVVTAVCVCAATSCFVVVEGARLVWGESDQGEQSVLGVAIWVRAFRAAGGASGRGRRGRREERTTSARGVRAVAAACVGRKLSALGRNTHPLFRCALVFMFFLFSFLLSAFSYSVVLVISRLRIWITESMLHFAVVGISERDRANVCGEVFFATVCVFECGMVAEVVDSGSTARNAIRLSFSYVRWDMCCRYGGTRIDVAEQALLLRTEVV